MGGDLRQAIMEQARARHTPPLGAASHPPSTPTTPPPLTDYPPD